MADSYGCRSHLVSLYYNYSVVTEGVTYMNKTKKFDLTKLTYIPTIVIIFIITQLPFVITIVFSFLKWRINRPDQGISFAGLKNYIYILTWPNFWKVILNTVIIIAACLVFCTVLGILLAVLFNRTFPGSFIFRTLMIMPYFVMEAVVGIVWKTLMLNPNMGLNYWITKWLGIGAIDFFGKYSLLTVIVLIIWQWVPFFFMIIIAGMQGLPTDVLESASLDGANAFVQLVQIKIPLIKNHIVTAMVLGLINILKVFGLVYVSTQGGPGVTSANLPYLTYRTIFKDWNVGRSAALAVITVIITMLISQNFYNFINKPESDYGDEKKEKKKKIFGRKKKADAEQTEGGV